MAETMQQYMSRLFGYVGKQSPLAMQRAAPGKIARLIRGVPRRRLLRRPAKGKWSVGEIIAHLADTELVAAWRLRMILSANGTPIQAFDQDKWARAGQYGRRDPRKSLELFRAVRAANILLLRSLRLTQWKQYGMHAERGRESVERIARLHAGHDINHLLQIRRILNK